MKKNSLYLLFFLLVVVIFSYSISSDSRVEEKKKQILSTTVMIDSVVGDIVGNKFTRTVLMEGEIDPHSYQIRKGDKEKFERATLVFANGLSLEHNPSLHYLLQSKNAVFLGDRVLRDSPEQIIINNNEIDPHIWMDLSLMQSIASMVCEEICKIDGENAAFYRENTKRLQEQMHQVDKEILALMESVPLEKRYLVSSHDAFNYFVRRYFTKDYQQRLFSMQGLSTESEISLKRMRQVIEFIKAHDIKAVFYESNLPKDSIWKMIEICKSYKMNVFVSSDPLYGDTLGGMSYLEMVKHDAQVIAKNLKES